MVLTMSMAISSSQPGRGRQKARTRAAMIAAARTLLAQGSTPTVEAAAAHAGISRATAYRYFTNQRELLLATHPMLDMTSLLPQDAPAHPTDRVMVVAEAIINLILDSEAELKMSLRLSLEPGFNSDLPLRKGRRLIWFEDALEPLKGKVKAATLKRLTHALAASVGVETFVWLVDIVGLPRKEAVNQLLWTARTLMDGAIGP
jgi:AcrR family transcriptional regulator